MYRTQRAAERRTRTAKPPQIGYRCLPNGDMVPLTEDDLLHPQEGDFVLSNDYHDSDRAYVKGVLRNRSAGRPRIRVISDHGIDFQQGDVQVLSPDITVLDGEPLEWDRSRAVFPVADMQSRIVLAMELTSKWTRRTDLVRKPPLYFRGGVPLYIISDLAYGGSKKPKGLLVFQAGSDGYEPLPLDVNGRFWLKAIQVWIGVENQRLACFDAQGNRIGDYSEEVARANAADARADAAEARIRELEAELKKSKKRKK